MKSNFRRINKATIKRRYTVCCDAHKGRCLSYNRKWWWQFQCNRIRRYIAPHHSDKPLKKNVVCVRFVSGTAIVSPPFWAFVRQWWRHARAVHNVTEQKMNRQKKILSKYLITTLFPIFCVSNISFFSALLFACFLRVFFFIFIFYAWSIDVPTNQQDSGLRCAFQFSLSYLYCVPAAEWQWASTSWATRSAHD